MAEINHIVGIKTSQAELFKTLSEISQLSQWWTKDTRGSTEVGGTIEFWFGDFQVDMKVLESTPHKAIKWQCTRGDDEWLGTSVEFKLEPTEDDIAVSFRHGGWKQATPLLGHCSMKWAVFLLSLKDLLETGTGRPFPNDIQISHS